MYFPEPAISIASESTRFKLRAWNIIIVIQLSIFTWLLCELHDYVKSSILQGFNLGNKLLKCGCKNVIMIKQNSRLKSHLAMS